MLFKTAPNYIVSRLKLKTLLCCQLPYVLDVHGGRCRRGPFLF